MATVESRGRRKQALRPGEHIVERGLTGRVNWYDQAKGIGRINSDDGRDGLHVHCSGLNTPRRTDDAGRVVELLAGESVRFDLADGDPRGPKCVNVELAE